MKSPDGSGLRRGGRATVFSLALLAALAPGFLRADEGRFQVAFQVGVQRHFAYGSETDYVPGENDFPVTPAHNASVFALSMSYAFKPWLALEYDGRFIGAAKLALSDPSDGDVLRCRSNRHFSFALGLVFRAPRGRLRPYVAVGGGLDRLEAKEETVVSDHGYEIYLAAPPESELIAPLIQLGGGVEVGVFKMIGIRLDGRYAIVLADAATVRALSLTAGLFLRL